ncbi:MAG: rhomboid family intramembrane serine protease, partial [Desulfatibacillaceae bacterium]|nr:rhomboid family intramembrane serine protease [Desulfatibacillaceae bacterium]
EKKSDGWQILTPASVAQKALEEIEAYQGENPPLPERPAPPLVVTRTGWWAAGVLLLFYIFLGSVESDRSLIRIWGADSAAILAGQVYRSITALFLHFDPVHLTGNMAGLGIFGTAVAQIAGAGAGWLMILLSGIVGNLINAAFAGPGHLSAGASTSVFGAMGWLAGYRMAPPPSPGARKKDRAGWIVLGAALTLLALLGNSPKSDFFAHLFGLAAGMGFGAGYARLRSWPLPQRWQLLCGMCIAAIVLLAFGG